MHRFKFWGAATVGTKGQIVIPAEAREELKLSEGDKLVVMRSPDGRGIILFKAEAFEKMVTQMQSKFGDISKMVKEIKK